MSRRSADRQGHRCRGKAPPHKPLNLKGLVLAKPLSAVGLAIAISLLSGPPAAAQSAAERPGPSIELLEKIALELRSAEGDGVIVDLADVGLLDSDSAPILKRMADEHGFRLDGIETLLQTSINTAERSSE